MYATHHPLSLTFGAIVGLSLGLTGGGGAQPLWTLVGAGLARKEATERAEKSVIPRRATWIHDAVTVFDPERNTLWTRNGNIIYLHCAFVSSCLNAADLLKKPGRDVRPLKQGYDELLKSGFPAAAK